MDRVWLFYLRKAAVGGGGGNRVCSCDKACVGLRALVAMLYLECPFAVVAVSCADLISAATPNRPNRITALLPQGRFR